MEQKPWPWPFLLCQGDSHRGWQLQVPEQEGGRTHLGAMAPLSYWVRSLYLKPLHVHDSFQ